MPKGVYKRTYGDIKTRILARVDKNPETGCWEWTGAKTDFGYGVMGALDKKTGKYRKQRVHRLSYQYLKNVDPSGRVVMHTCDNPSCVNPDHLKLGSYRTNNLDMARKGRHGGAKCDPPLVRVMRLAYANGINCSALAECSGLAKSTVHKIVTGTNYAHVEDGHA